MLFMLNSISVGISWGQLVEVEDELPVVANKEYIFQQQADEILVVRVSASEAQFESRVSTETGEILVESGLRDARMMPIFQLIPASDVSRQVNINVDATRITNRTEFEMGLTRLNIRDNRSRVIANTYQSLSSGIAKMENGSAAQWTVRIQTLFSAADQFETIGMEEMRLWARTFGTHLVLHKLQDYQTAVDWSNELLRQPRISRYPELEFAAKKLRSTAMSQGYIGVGGNNPVESPFQQALAETIEIANRLDYRFEEALALMSGGVDLIDHGLNRQAQGMFTSALEIAVDIEADDLATAIREYMVEAYSQVGETDATGDILEDIETHLVDEGDEQELSLNLIQQGQVHFEGQRYTQAIEVLERAVLLEQSELSRLQAELALGMALSAAGRVEEAIVHLYRAVFNARTGEYRRTSNVLNVSAGLEELAAIHRYQQDWDRLNRIRDEQQANLGSPTLNAVHSYQLATDALFRYGTDSSTTLNRYDRAFRQADGAGQEELRDLARLGLCALPARAGGEGICHSGEIRIAFDRLRRSELQRRAAEAALFFARIQNQSGNVGRAFDVSNELIGSLIENSYTSLGSWYWHWRGFLTTDFLAYAMRSERNGSSDASRSFLALLKARMLERGSSGLQAMLNRESLDAYLSALPRNTSILSYFLDENTATAWIAGQQGVQRQSLSRPSRIRTLIDQMRISLGRETWKGSPANWDHFCLIRWPMSWRQTFT